MNLTSLEHEILRLHHRLSLTTTVEDAWRIGELLAQGKEELPHGAFLPWVRRMGLSVRSAQEYLVVYRHFDKAQHAAHLSLRGFLAGWRRAKRAACVAEFGANQEAAERASRNAQPDPWVRHADAYTFPGWPSGINVVATDPPWQDDRAYEWLASIAVERLTDRGILLVQAAVGGLPQRIQVFLDAGLSYRWTLAIVYSQMTFWKPSYLFIPNWRPVLVFSKGKWPGCSLTTDTMTIFNSSKKSKVHPWEQPLQPWLKWLQALSRPGQLVCDPFCGTGTIAVAVKMLGEGRRFLGTEKELKTARLAWSRLSSVE